jgi:uncharacterized membrane protein
VILYFDYVLNWWAHRDDDNVLVVNYEDMKKDLPSAVAAIAKFIGQDIVATSISYSSVTYRYSIMLLLAFIGVLALWIVMYYPSVTSYSWHVHSLLL